MAVFKHMKPGSLYRWMGLLLFSIILFSFTTADTKSQYRIPIAAYSVTAGDIDLDGDNDVVVGHKTAWQNTNPTISILENINNGIFTIIDTSFIFCGYQENIFAVCMDDDNYPDIVSFMSDFTTGVAERYIRIFYNYFGTFDMFLDFPLNSSETFSAITFGDINGDDNLDIIIASHNGQFWGYMLNDGSGNLASPFYIYVQDYYPPDIACGDLNDDGWDDVVVVGQKTEVYFSYPGSFTQLELESNDWKGGVFLSDFDQDGDMDILTIGGALITTILKMHENMGNNTFSTHDAFTFQPLASRFFISDFNNDSFPDLLFQLDDNTGYVIYYNQGNFQLGDSLFIAVEAYEYEGRNCFCCDLDGNNFNDIIITRLSQVALPDNLVLLFNDGNGNFVENPVAVYDTQMPESEKPMICYPNPFSDQLTIEIKLEHPNSDSKIEMFDIKGNLVKTFETPGLVSNKYTIKWDGKDLDGNMIKPGTYIVCAKMDGHKYVRRVIKIPY